MNAKQLLEETLSRAVKIDAEELWLLSGVGILAMAEDGVRPVHTDSLSAEAVRAVHEECLGVAGRKDLRSFAHARYTVTFSNVGTFLCEFIYRRNTSNLRLQREPEPLMVEPGRKPTLPSLAAEAKPISLHRSG
jgi:Tfp pilus assembly ATPase PilU